MKSPKQQNNGCIILMQVKLPFSKSHTVAYIHTGKVTHARIQFKSIVLKLNAAIPAKFSPQNGTTLEAVCHRLEK
jgi:hypothetical protein